MLSIFILKTLATVWHLRQVIFLMAVFIIVRSSLRGGRGGAWWVWVSLLPFQNAIRIQTHVFVPVSGLCFGPTHCIHLWVTKSCRLTTEVPVNITLASLALDSGRICWCACQTQNHTGSHRSTLRDKSVSGFNRFSIELRLHLPSSASTARAHRQTSIYPHGTLRPFSLPPLEFLLEKSPEAAADWLLLAQHPTETLSNSLLSQLASLWGK